MAKAGEIPSTTFEIKKTLQSHANAKLNRQELYPHWHQLAPIYSVTFTIQLGR